MFQKAASRNVTRLHQLRNRLKVQLRLLGGPEGHAFRKRLQAEQAIARRMARDTPGVPWPLLDEYWLNFRDENVEIQRRLRRNREASQNGGYR